MFNTKVIYSYRAQNTENNDTKYLYTLMIFGENIWKKLEFYGKGAQLRLWGTNIFNKKGQIQL